MKKQDFKNKEGFTLVEMLVSMSLFTILMIVGVGAILTANVGHKKTQVLRQAFDTLSFVMEDFSRTARLGDRYHCETFFNGNNVNATNIENPEDGLGCIVFAYEPYWDISTESDDPDATEQDQIIYVLAEIEDIDGLDKGVLFKAPNTFNLNGVVDFDDFVRLTPPEIDLDLTRSGFDVVGSGDDGLQPRVTFILKGEARSKGVTTDFNLQTTVSQRLLQPNP